jgi:hypothetical protein
MQDQIPRKLLRMHEAREGYRNVADRPAPNLAPRAPPAAEPGICPPVRRSAVTRAERGEHSASPSPCDRYKADNEVTYGPQGRISTAYGLSMRPVSDPAGDESLNRT